MDINSIILMILLFITGYILFISGLLVLGFIFINRNINKKLDIKSNEVRNDLYRIYMDIDLIKTEETLDNILKDYINKWVLINITANGEDYIKEPEVQELIKYVTTNFIANMSDVHLFYIRCLTTISNDDDIIRFIRNKVKYLVLDFITDYNML